MTEKQKGNPSVIEIVKDWLKEHGFDGLYNVDSQCGCAVDDFVLCGQIYLDCQAGYKAKMGSDSEDDYGIGPEKDLWYWSKRTQKNPKGKNNKESRG